MRSVTKAEPGEPEDFPEVCDKLVGRLLESYGAGPRYMNHLGAYELPQMSEVVRCVDDVRALMFPGFVGTVPGHSPEDIRAAIRDRLLDLSRRLRRQVYRGLHHRCQIMKGSRDLDCSACAEAAEGITRRFVHALPEIRARLATDVDSAYEGDPAATGTDEIVFCYPGLYAITCYRAAHVLLLEGSHIIPRMITEHAHERTGIDIHPGARIGSSFFIDHGTGVVIGETSVIGDRVRLYQGVTLGAISLPKGRGRPVEGKRRHPQIEDDVIIYAGATILGGDTVIGKGAIIGGNTWVTRSVPPGGRVVVDGTTVGPL
jgi:serine O-acetyltransferase